MIPQTTLDTINAALAEVSLTTTPDSVCADDEDVKKSLARHPDKEVIWFEFPIDVTPDKKRALMKALGKVATVTSYGLLVPAVSADAPADMGADPDIQREMAAIAAEEAPIVDNLQVAPILDSRGSVEGNSKPEPAATAETLKADMAAERAAVRDAEPLRPVRTSDIKVSITPTELDRLLNDPAVTILYMWGSGSAFNVAYYRVQS